MQALRKPVLCLLVEDNPLVGLDLADALDVRGYFVAGPFPRGRDAFEWLAQFTPDVAIVDLTLRDGMCHEVIRMLQMRAVPFIVYSGTPVRCSPLDLPADVPWLEKPASCEEIVRTLQERLSRSIRDVNQPPSSEQQTGDVAPPPMQ